MKKLTANIILNINRLILKTYENDCDQVRFTPGMQLI